MASQKNGSGNGSVKAADVKNTQRLAVRAAVNGGVFSPDGRITRGMAEGMSAAYGLALAAIPHDRLTFKPWHGRFTEGRDAEGKGTGVWSYDPQPQLAQQSYDAHLKLWRGTVLGRGESRYPVVLSYGVAIGHEIDSIAVACVFSLADDALTLARECLPAILADARRDARKVLKGKLILDDAQRAGDLAHIARTAAVLDSHPAVRAMVEALIIVVDSDAAVKRAAAAVKRAVSAGESEDVIATKTTALAKADSAAYAADQQARGVIATLGLAARGAFFPTVDAAPVVAAETAETAETVIA